LRDLLAGCPGGAAVGGVRAVGTEWAVADLDGGSKAFLRRGATGWRLTALLRPALAVEFENAGSTQPTRVALRSRDGGANPGFDLSLRLSQVEHNADVPAEAFSVRLPEQGVPITLEELRRAGPMRDSAPASAGGPAP
jgi:hypothetical protein